MTNKKFSPALGLLIFSVFILIFPSCCKDDNPEISELKLCDSPPSGEIECEGDKSTFTPTDPTIAISSFLDGVSPENNVTFSLYFDNDGELALIGEEILNLGNASGEDSGCKFRAGKTFSLPANFTWNQGDWQIDVSVDTDTPVSQTKRFKIE